MKRIGVISKNERLVQKLRLILRAEYEVVHTEGNNGDELLMIFQDIDTTEARSDTVHIGRGVTGGDGIGYPFRHEDILRAVSERDCGEEPQLICDGRNAILGGERIRLTEVESRLLEELVRADGFVSREELVRSVWGGECDGGVVNVYIHYLREKLERDGRRVILSSRKEGYRINEIFKKGEK
ncbi:MAG: winged helix-turn-helix transcriptional regulator [Clostridia bacterium]|nr:winged helix-turn-helix transcriptional regulator [Clostridia bacterium]